MSKARKTGGCVFPPIFVCRALPVGTEEPYKNTDMILIRLRLKHCDIVRKSVMIGHDPPYVVLDKSKTPVQKIIMIPHLSRFKQNTRASRQIMGEFLSSMGVPEDQQFRCLPQIFDVALAEPPLKPVLVVIYHVNYRYLKPSVDEVVMKRDEFPDDEGLEWVHRDSLEANGVSSSCAICMEEYGFVDCDRELTRLPCLHIFHAICILTWHRKNPNCPLCRYSMPPVYVLNYIFFTHHPSPQTGGVQAEVHGCCVGLPPQAQHSVTTVE